MLATANVGNLPNCRSTSIRESMIDANQLSPQELVDVLEIFQDSQTISGRVGRMKVETIRINQTNSIYKTVEVSLICSNNGAEYDIPIGRILSKMTNSISVIRICC